MRVNDFWITYNKQNAVSQFYSDISFLKENGSEIYRKTIYVNSPAVYKNNYFYQIDWDLIGVRFIFDDLEINQSSLINVGNDTNKIWFSWITTNPELTDGLTLLTNNLQGYLSVYDKSGGFLGNIELNENTRFQKSISLIDIISSTGLQIKMDPGIPIIYSGFGFLMVSTLTSYITYSQIWIIQNNKTNSLIVGGNTTRAKFDFDFEFFKLTLAQDR